MHSSRQFCLLEWTTSFYYGCHCTTSPLRFEKMCIGTSTFTGAYIKQITRSDWSSVTSGTPQGTILSPLLFLIYINDINNCVSSTVKLYAGDSKIYHQIVDPIKDPQLLQMDLSNLMEWARKLQLRFNAEVCESMRRTHTRYKSIM